MSRLESRYILVVEDSDVDFDILESTLIKNSIRIRLERESTGENAVNSLKKMSDNNSPLPSVILMDLNLIGMSGVDATKQIRSIWNLKLCPIVILSTSSNHVDVAASYAAGANSFIAKPLQFEKFELVVLNFFEYWFSSSVLPTDISERRLANSQ